MDPALAAEHAERIAASAAHAAWAGAAASTLASVTALSVALWSARREERRRLRQAADERTAFAFGMVGALEMAKPLLAAAQDEPGGACPPQRFLDTISHAQRIGDAALAIQVFDMQMLRDAYVVRGVLDALRNLGAVHQGAAVPHRAVLEVVAPVLDNLLEADDRFYARLPSLEAVKGVHAPTHLRRGPAAAT